jgi:ferredoxin-NADP reductase
MISKRHTTTVPSRPENLVSQTYDTIISICRELAYPQIWWLRGSFTRFFNPPALGRCLLLLVYWVAILTALWTNVILTPSSPNYAYKWEIVGFRAAWVSVTQLPLIYCLSSKVNVISLITGISYERLNWLHRWIARTLFLTVIVHWSFFFREWWIADFVKLELEMMPMVKFGFGAWSVLGWMVITGFGFFRQLSYEFFVLQHIASFIALLWLVYTHVPSYAKFNVWMAIGFVAFDRGARSVLWVVQNLHLRSKSNENRQKYLLGFSAHAEALSADYVRLTINDVNFSWKAGQHVFVSIPRCGFSQSHPFTLARLPETGSAKIILRARSGFTKSLLHLAHQQPHQDLRTFISQPYGSPPLDIVERSDSLIVIATSTGASFTVPIMQHAINRSTSIRRICFYWIVRHLSHLDWFSSDVESALRKARSHGIEVRVQTFITQEDRLDTSIHHDVASDSTYISVDTLQAEKRLLAEGHCSLPNQEKVADAPMAHVSLLDTAESDSSRINVYSKLSQHKSNGSSLPSSFGRPESIDSLIRPTIEDSDGETAIIACGNASLMAELRNYTAALSDERAVHKGTGAQGIFLFTETYGW